MFLHSSVYFEAIGFIGLCIEATLSLPQALRNHRRKSTEGLSLFLVFNWIIGDLARFVIFYLRESPVCYHFLSDIVVHVFFIFFIYLFIYL